MLHRALSVPVFCGEVVSLLESRSVHRVERPHVGEPVAAKKVNKNNIQPWSYSFSQATSYERQEEESEIVDSREVQTCYECTGQGHVTCHTCSGGKQVTCTGCSGQTRVACPKCQGNGKVNQPYTENYQVKCENCARVAAASVLLGTPDYCGTCRGRGWIEKQRQVDSWVPCANCSASGQVTCGRCSGTGRIDCSTCRGGGVVTCGQCEGQRNLLHALVVRRHLIPEIRKTNFAPPGIGQDLVEMLSSSDFVRMVNEHQQVITVNMVDSAEPAEFRKNLQLQIADIHRLTGDNKRYYRMWLGVSCSMVDVVDYQFERQKFRAFFLGEAKRCHAPNSPATWSIENKVRQAFTLWAEYEFPDAIVAYRQCLKMAKKDEGCRLLLREYQKKHRSWLPTCAKYGILIAAVAVIGVLGGLFLLVRGCVSV